MSKLRMHMDCQPDHCWLDHPSPCELFTHEDCANPAGPVVEAKEYCVYPTNFRDIPFSDRDSWVLYVSDGGSWGWSVRDFAGGQGRAMNRKGDWLFERRGHRGNRFRRYPLEEALALAVKFVDKRKVVGLTAAEAIARGPRT